MKTKKVFNNLIESITLTGLLIAGFPEIVLSNNASVAQPDEAVVLINQSVTISVLDNDLNVEDGAIVRVSDNIEGGNAEVRDNEIVFTAGDIPGTYTFSYIIGDDSENPEAVAEVSVEIFMYAD